MNLFNVLFAATISLPTLAFAGEPVNTNCPLSGNPVNPEHVVTVGDDTVALCCGGCVGGFKKWDESRQLAFIAEQKTSKETPDAVEETSALAVNTPYLLESCPISGEELGSMDSIIVENIDGREVKFCCAKCATSFKDDKKAQFKKLDALMIKQQLPFYPTNTCVISGEPLDFHGGAVNFIYGNRLFRTCCNDCKREFLDEPAKHVPELDEAIIKKQKRSYPLTNCVIGKGPLDGMGGPNFLIVGNRLVKLCCDGCEAKVLKNPLATFLLIDAAKN